MNVSVRREMEAVIAWPSLLRTRRIDAICSEFETSWRSGRQPRIEAVLADAEPASRSSLLAELVALEFQMRREAGEAVQVAEYLQRFRNDETAVLTALAQVTDRDSPGASCSPRNKVDSEKDAARYRLGRQVGAGGMGVVYSAQDRHLDRELAIKVLAEHLQTRREAVERFLREARICARLQHPGIVPIHELGWMGERPYFTMKLVHGRSLSELLAARRDAGHELPRWLEVFQHVCETVAYAHAQGVVHRDLKPANVMLGPFGEAYVIDWGLAKRLDGDCPHPGPLPEGEGGGEGGGGDLDTPDPDRSPDPIQANASAAWTFLGDVVGTPAFLAPEQACGDIDVIDRRTDVFALGAMLCEILTGTPPYAGGDGTTQLEQAQRGDLAETLARLDACRADRELIELARDCLAVEPAERPADAGQVSERLTAFLRGVQEKLQKFELERAEDRARTQERRRRRRIVLSLAACLVFLLGLFGAAGAWFAEREAARRRDETAHREQVQRQLAETLDEIDQLYAEAPEDWREDPLRRTRIRELAHRAETLAESPWSGRAAVQRVEQLRARIQAEDADGRLLDCLEEIRLKTAEVNPRTNKFASGRTRPLYRNAFKDYGLDLEKVDAQSAVEKIRTRPAHVVEACVFGLESWRLLFKTAVPQRQWIDAVLDGIDDDRWRRDIRRAVRERDWAATAPLIEAAPIEKLSADAVHVVAMRLINAGQFDLALPFLQAARREHPGDFWVNEYLAIVYFSRPAPQLDESVRFFTAALAIRETGAAYLNLGAALFELQRDAEAEQAFRAALRLQPGYVRAHLSLADVLQRQGRTAEAAALRERAEQLQAAPKPKTKDADDN